MYLCSAHRSKVRPCNRVKMICIKQLRGLKHHLRVEVEYLEQEYDVGLQQVLGTLIDHEFFPPLCQIHALDSQVKHLCTQWHQVV